MHAAVLRGLLLGLLALRVAAAPAVRQLAPVGWIQDSLIAESSALQASRRLPGVFWTLNDSGDEARIFAIDSAGVTIRPAWARDYRGLRVANAANLDWEALAQDDEGHLLIGACGNNSNARRDLAIYMLPEPNPRAVEDAVALKPIFFSFPDQRDFPPATRNFDCEAIFFARGAVHFLTKHRGDSRTRLYRLDPLEGERALPGRPWHETFRPDLIHPLTLLGEADVAGLDPALPGLVTDADATLDGRRVAILSYAGVFIIDNPAGGEAERTGNLLAGEWRWLPIAAQQCEGLTLAGDTLWITNEQREIFRLPVAELLPREGVAP